MVQLSLRDPCDFTQSFPEERAIGDELGTEDHGREHQPVDGQRVDGYQILLLSVVVVLRSAATGQAEMGESLQIDQPEQDAIDGEGTEVDEAGEIVVGVDGRFGLGLEFASGRVKWW